MAQSWLIIERIENWQADKASGFSMFGLSSRYESTAASMAKGDAVFCYVSSGISSFSDIRVITETQVRPRRGLVNYDSNFDYHLGTAPALILEPARWLPLKEVLNELDLTKGRKEWRQMFRTSLRRLTSHDATLLRARLEARAVKQQ